MLTIMYHLVIFHTLGEKSIHNMVEIQVKIDFEVEDQIKMEVVVEVI